MKLKYIIAIALIFVGFASQAQVPTPAAEQEEAILLKGGVAHLGNGKVINNSLIGFDDGKISIVEDAATSKLDIVGYKVIDITGKHVYPGFILANSRVGLQEVSSLRAMNDNAETAGVNPNVRALVAYNTDSEMPPTFRFNGILLAETTPNGGRISGTSSLMNMDGWNWQDAAQTVDVAIHLNWPNLMNREFDFATFTRKTVPNKNYQTEIGELETTFDDAIAYAKLASKVTNLKMEAMQGLFDGTQTLVIHASGPKEIVDGVSFAKSSGVQRIVVAAGTSALAVAPFLKEHSIGVVLPPVHSLPSRADMDVDLPYRLPALLTDAGIKVALSHQGMLSGGRNLAFYAGTAVAYGMDKEAALQAITLNPAEMLGVADKVGTLEEGKEATLFVSEGDALDIRTNKLTSAYIQGRTIILDNKQQALYKRYSDKYGHGE